MRRNSVCLTVCHLIVRWADRSPKMPKVSDFYQQTHSWWENWSKGQGIRTSFIEYRRSLRRFFSQELLKNYVHCWPTSIFQKLSFLPKSRGRIQQRFKSHHNFIVKTFVGGQIVCRGVVWSSKSSCGLKLSHVQRRYFNLDCVSKSLLEFALQFHT